MHIPVIVATGLGATPGGGGSTLGAAPGGGGSAPKAAANEDCTGGLCHANGPPDMGMESTADRISFH